MMKVVMIGLGSIGKKHVDALSKMKAHQFEIFALRHSKQSASEYSNVTNIYDLEQIDFEPDFFIVSNPTYCHFETIQSLLPFNKPMFIEKPAVMHLHEGAVLAEAFSKTNLLNYVGCNLRFLEVLKFAKAYLQKNDFRINEINIYAGSDMPNWRPNQNFREVYSANAEMGGGIHLDFIHEIDYLYWFFGKPMDATKVLRSQSSLEITAIDYANYTFIYEEFAASVILNYYRKDRARTFEMVTDQGTLLIEIEKGKVYFNQEIIFTTEQSILDTYTSQMEYFINCIETNTKPMNTFAEAFEVLKMCLNNE